MLHFWKSFLDKLHAKKLISGSSSLYIDSTDEIPLGCNFSFDRPPKQR